MSRKRSSLYNSTLYQRRKRQVDKFRRDSLIDLVIEQNRAYNNVVKRDLPLDFESMKIHLKSEVKELDRAANFRSSLSLIDLCNIKDDKEFLDTYRIQMKDTEADEIADIIITSMTIAEHKGIDSERVVMIKQRVNSLRLD